ncbi:MAG: CPBP family intramembrane glutamic endopeptidase [Candidatus Acidiferrales bacterium]
MTPEYEATNPAAHSGEIAPAHSAPSAVENIFKGPNGIRAGWRLLIFIALFMAMIRGVDLIPAVHAFTHAQDRQTMTPASLIVLEGVSVLCLLVAAFVMSRIEKRTFADYYLPPNRAFGKRFWQGIPYGFAMLSLLLVLIAAFRGFSLEGWALAGTEALKYGALYGVGFILVGIFEEFSFRGYMQSTLTSGIGFWWAAVILSIVFGAGHLQNLGESVPGAVMAGSFGVLAAFSLKRTGNIWFPIGMHAAWDWGETYFYSVPDSGFLAKGHLLNSTFHGATWLTGGKVGPEGSAFAFVVLVLGGVGIHFLFPAKRQMI